MSFNLLATIQEPERNTFQVDLHTDCTVNFKEPCPPCKQYGRPPAYALK